MADNAKTKKYDITRKQIIDAAFALMNEKGFDAVTVSEIAERANVAKGLIYYYFSSKEDILKTIGTLGDTTYARAYELASEEKTFADAIKVFFVDTYGEYKQFGKEIIKSCLINSLNTSASRFTDENIIRGYLKLLYEEAVERKEIRDDENFNEFCQQLMAFTLGTEFIWCASNSEEDLQELIGKRFDNFLKGFLR